MLESLDESNTVVCEMTDIGVYRLSFILFLSYATIPNIRTTVPSNHRSSPIYKYWST